ncbi:hypothetical protein CBS101457_003526 [Exobasidium rhododendri]|nr:hypothetical protein CBS101457_003526 [Exobasidium rhododendri]
MSTKSSTTYKGTLRSKRKNELIDIANALGLNVEEDLGKRDEVEHLIKTHLLDNRASLQSHSTWSGLYHSIDQSDRRAARSSSIASPESDGSDDGNSGQSPRKHTIKAKVNGLATPLRKSTSSAANTALEGASSFTSALQASTRRSIDNLSSAFKSGATEVREEVREEIHDAASEVSTFWVKTKKYTRTSVRRAEVKGKHALRRAQLYLSDSTNLTALFLILEASVLVSNVMPLTEYGLGERSIKNFIKSGGKTTSGTLPHLSLTVPNFMALLSYAFWRPILLWSVWTVAIPLLAAHLITFDRKQEPSAVTFNITRLAIVSTITKSAFSAVKPLPHVMGVAPGEIRQAVASWSGSIVAHAQALVNYTYVSAFVNPELQIFLTSLAAAFAIYELVANRPRSSTHA